MIIRIRLLRFIIVLLSFTIILGCGNRSSKPNTITVWHWMTDRDESFQELAKKYKELTGTTVIFELYAPSDSYSQKVVAAAHARVLPDIFGILDKKIIIASFIKSGSVANLTEEFTANNQEWENRLFPKALAVNRFTADNPFGVEAGIYGVPIDVTNIQMLYNKKLLAKAGIHEPPKTFDEFLEVARMLKRIGISVLVSGWGEEWMVRCFASNYAFNIMGKDKVLATYRGDVPYTGPDRVKGLKVFKELRDNGALIEGIVTKANKYAEQDFALERAAFAFNGSWCVNVYNDMNPDLDYGVMLPPAIESEFPIRIWGGAGSSFVVNNISPNKDKAIAFLKWITAEEQQATLSRETKNLPANREALASIPKILSAFATSMDKTTHPTIWEINENPLVTETFDKGIQSIIIGEKSPQEVVQEVQKIKEREMSKANKYK